MCNERFEAGRDEGNHLILTKTELPEKILSRVSKVHFRIIKDLSDVTNPVYIEVSILIFNKSNLSSVSNVFKQDLSRNGTFLNGERIGMKKRQILLNDDVISLAHPQYKSFVYKNLSPNEADGLPKDICLNYHIGRKLGEGACGVVRLVYNRKTCEPFAMKHIKKNQLITKQTEPKRINNEAVIMKSLQHPCVVRMHDIVDNTDSVFIMLELMQGGDLLTRIIKKQRLSERISKLFFLQMCHAVKYLHDKNITHRDLKPDNVLLHSTDEETLLKVSDFGLSKAVNNDSVMRTLCGTPLYVAPEVLMTGGRGSYTCKVDIWSLGVVLFTMLSGTLPFSDEYGTAASDQIKRGKFVFRANVWRGISLHAKQLIVGMLTVDADKRLSIDQVLSNQWLDDEEVLRKAEKITKLSLNLPHQENVSANFLQPPAAKRRRIEPQK